MVATVLRQHTRERQDQAASFARQERDAHLTER